MRRTRFVVHNLVAHPLLVLCPPLGRFLHDGTIAGIDERLEIATTALAEIALKPRTIDRDDSKVEWMAERARTALREIREPQS